MSQHVSKQQTSLQGASKTKRGDTDNECDTDQSRKKCRHETTTTISNDSTTTVTTATGNCDQDFEKDIAKAIKLSLMSAEELYDTKLEATLTFDQEHRPQHKQCPLCDAYFDISESELERHVNQCLDQSSNLLSIPTTTMTEQQQKDASWGHIFQAIPKTLHNSWVGKMLSTVDKSSSANGSVTAATSTIESKSTVSVSPTPILDVKRKRQVPKYKWMKGTKYIVDGFNYGKVPNCDGYFLTHFHSDHYGGLNNNWSAGPIYCSQVTANLVAKQLGVDETYLRVLPMNETTFVQEHIKITLIDANHCPGSVLFIFDIQQPSGHNKSIWVRHLHTGDFRANPQMCLHPLLRQPENPTIDNLYLDTTYLNAKYGFPAQEECIQAACRVIEVYMGLKNENRPKTMLEQWMKKETTETKSSPTAFDTMMSNAKMQKKTQGLLVVVGTYSIGKEKVFCAIAKLLKSKIYTSEQKRVILRCQENPELENMLTRDPLEAQVHILPLNQIKAETMHAYMKKLSPRFTNIIAFKPTGWTYRPSKAQETEMSIGSLSQVTMAPTDRTLYLKPSHSSPTMQIYGVPYSEHSSFRELASFIASLDINHVVPTVYCETEKGRQRMFRYLEKWQQDKQGKPIEIVPYPVETHW